MPHQTPRLGLRRRGLPLALACALAAGVGGCSTWRMHDLAWFGSSRSYCTSDEAWPTKVKGSLQRAETGWETTRYEPEERSEPEAEACLGEDAVSEVGDDHQTPHELAA